MSNKAVADLTEAKLQIEANLCSVQRKAMRLLVEPVEGEQAQQLRGEITAQLGELTEAVEAYRRRVLRYVAPPRPRGI